jgi:hypothetical protein
MLNRMLGIRAPINIVNDTEKKTPRVTRNRDNLCCRVAAPASAEARWVMDDFIVKGNIKRFEQQLKDVRGERERKVLLELLAIERERLNEAQDTPR